MPKDKVDKIFGSVANLTKMLVHIKGKIDTEMVIQKQFEAKNNDVLNHVDHIDGFVKLHQTLDGELVSLRHKYDRLEDRVKVMETKLGVAANVEAGLFSDKIANKAFFV